MGTSKILGGAIAPLAPPLDPALYVTICLGILLSITSVLMTNIRRRRRFESSRAANVSEQFSRPLYEAEW